MWLQSVFVSLPLSWWSRCPRSSQAGCPAGGWTGSCWPAGQWGGVGWQEEAVCWRQQMGGWAPPDAGPWTCRPPRCRQPGSWSHVGRGWALFPDWSTGPGGVSSHFWLVLPPSTAGTLPWRIKSCIRQMQAGDKSFLISKNRLH